MLRAAFLNDDDASGGADQQLIRHAESSKVFLTSLNRYRLKTLHVLSFQTSTSDRTEARDLSVRAAGRGATRAAALSGVLVQVHELVQELKHLVRVVEREERARWLALVRDDDANA